jgi:hypothetical protein
VTTGSLAESKQILHSNILLAPYAYLGSSYLGGTYWLSPTLPIKGDA